MTGLCSVLFGLGDLLPSVMWFNILLALVQDTSRRHRLTCRSVAADPRLFLAVAKGLGMLDYRIDGAGILRQERGYFVVANHPTLVDYILLASVMPETDCLAENALLKNPFLSGIVRVVDYLINSEAETLLPRCQQRLAQGGTIPIFPEGVRAKPGEEMTLQCGVANTAVCCISGLRIVAIGYSEHLLDKQSKWYDALPSRPFFTAEVHRRVGINRLYDVASQEPTLTTRQLNRHLLLQLQ